MAPAHPNPQTKSSQQTKATQPTRSGQGSDPRSQSWSHYHLDQKTISKVKPALLKIAFLGLKVMVVCFDKQLSKDWLRVVHCLRDMESRGEGGVAMWDFLDFSVSYRSPLSLLIRPFILLKLKQSGGNEAVMQYKAAIKDKLCGASLPPSVCKGALLRTLGQHLKILRDELQSDKAPEESNLRPPSLEIQSEVSQVLRRTKTSTEVEKRSHSPTRSGKGKLNDCIPGHIL
ncbi:hypothetical protein Anas_01863 [Armadillidium nasatum]|uniref:Protein UNC80 C-terminal domain-containing protein n=1 Tax=Armadillidium nasatum TaxID=96803 RepID=A0A5N5TLX3_9CRUS|nr:hypothetical protein Anas_01863 [Armadillidium nasatum]